MRNKPILKFLNIALAQLIASITLALICALDFVLLLHVNTPAEYKGQSLSEIWKVDPFALLVAVPFAIILGVFFFFLVRGLRRDTIKCGLAIFLFVLIELNIVTAYNGFLALAGSIVVGIVVALVFPRLSGEQSAPEADPLRRR
jgi:hypothetical protein